VDSVPSVVTLFYHNPEWQVLAEYDGAGELQRYYVYGNYIDEPLVMNDGTDDYYYAHDHLYSTVALIDDGGDVVERYEYDAYGTVHILDAGYNTRTVSSYGNPYAFTGRRLDVLDNAGLLIYYYRHRTYDPYTARFLQHDSLFEYVKSLPLVQIDPYGLLKDKCKPGEKGYDILDIVFTPYRVSPFDKDVVKASDFVTDWIDLQGAVELITAVVVGSVEWVAGCAVTSGYTYACLEAYNNAKDAITDIKDYLKQTGWESYLIIQKKTCEKERCWWTLWLGSRYNWKKDGRRVAHQCTVGSYVETGLYLNGDPEDDPQYTDGLKAAGENVEACKEAFEASFDFGVKE